MEMSVDEARSQISSFQIDHVARFIIPQTDHTPIFDRNVCAINLPAKNIDEVGVFEKHFSGSFTPCDAEFLLQVPHRIAPITYHSMREIAISIEWQSRLGSEAVSDWALAPCCF